MENEWQSSVIGDLAAPIKNALVGGPFGSNLVSRDYVDVGVPVIRGQNMGARWIGGEFAYVSLEKAEELSPNTARPGDLVFTQRGTLGQVAIVPNGPFERYIVSQSQMKLTVDASKADTLFLYYFFTSAAQQEYIQRNAIQTGVPHTNLEHLRTTPIILPSLPEQQAIAGVLDALDNKIELNRRENRTLEAMARALFKSWFVDFDPVRAKAAGREPEDMDAATAALFPDGFEESEMGDVPQGWHIGTLKDIADITMGQSPPGETYNETGEGSPFYQGTRDFGPRFPSRRVYCVAPSRFAETGDILFSVRAPVGSINVATERCAIGRGVAALRSPMTGNGFLFYWLKGNNQEWAKFEASGTVFGSVSRSDIANVRLIIPSDQLRIRFGHIVEAWDQQYLANERESQTLADLRDTLLPKLLSGEVRVSS